LKIKPIKSESTKPLSAHREDLALADPQSYLHKVAGVVEQLPFSAIDQVVDRLFQAYVENSAIYIFGNGGSASLASHVACDLGKGTVKDGNRPFRAMSLTDNVALITAWANDTRYEDIFTAQLRPLIQAGDVAFAISASGNSPNVINALRCGRDAEAFNIGLTGFQGGNMKSLCDLCVTVPADNMQQIEDCHLCVMHAVFLSLRNLVWNANLAPVPRARK
jgi:D-sedoheptulose 7-phosphate isomerase